MGCGRPPRGPHTALLEVASQSPQAFPGCVCHVGSPETTEDQGDSRDILTVRQDGSRMNVQFFSAVPGSACLRCCSAITWEGRTFDTTTCSLFCSPATTSASPSCIAS